MAGVTETLGPRGEGSPERRTGEGGSKQSSPLGGKPCLQGARMVDTVPDFFLRLCFSLRIDQCVRPARSPLPVGIMASATWLASASLCDLLCLVLDALKVQENEDNLAVFQAARDSFKLIQNKFLPTVCSWVQVRQDIWPSAVNSG